MEDHSEQSGLQGFVHSIERCASVDGPGLRMVVFLAGCPLNCQYCHNPDTQKMKTGTLHTVEEVLEEIRPYIPFLEQNGGGVTLSGGEPLAQPEFTRALLAGVKEMGLSTALDTSGYMGKMADDDLLALVDLVLLDIKSGLPETFKTTTGVDLAPTIAFANRLKEMNKPVWVRFVLVPGLTDAPENVKALGEIIAALPNVKRVEVLPFHKMGETKWREMNRDYKLYETPEPTPALIAKTLNTLRTAGVADPLLY